MSLIVHLSRYVWASILCSLGGFLFGWVLSSRVARLYPRETVADHWLDGRMDTGIIGSVVVMQQFTQKFGSFSSIVHGLVVSAILIPVSDFYPHPIPVWIFRWSRPRCCSCSCSCSSSRSWPCSWSVPVPVPVQISQPLYTVLHHHSLPQNQHVVEG